MLGPRKASFASAHSLTLLSSVRRLRLSPKTMANFASIVVLAVLVAVCSGASFGGVKDFAGNYYDFTTGQYASALTGKVYNTAPVAYVPPVAPVAPVVAASALAAPYYYNAAPYVAPYTYTYGPAAYVAPFWKK